RRSRRNASPSSRVVEEVRGMTSLPALDPATVVERTGSGYPEPFRAPFMRRAKKALGNEVGLTHFGVNLTRLEPGAWSSQRHWHTRQDEFVYVLQGELVLVTDAGEQTLRAGMAAGLPAGKPEGQHLVHRSHAPPLYPQACRPTYG